MLKHEEAAQLEEKEVDETITGATAVEPADLEAAIQHYLAETDRALAHMRRDQTEIERLKAETKVFLADTETMLDNLKKSV
jgi:hypothetical protein